MEDPGKGGLRHGRHTTSVVGRLEAGMGEGGHTKPWPGRGMEGIRRWGAHRATVAGGENEGSWYGRRRN